MKKNCNLSLETKLESIRTNYLARVKKRNLLVNFDPKGETCEEPREGQRTIRDFKSITDEELNIIIKDFQLFSIHFATELRNTFKNIHFRRKQNKKWKKEMFILYMLEITEINHNFPEILFKLEQKTFQQFEIDLLTNLIESFVLKWWCPENPEIQQLIYHVGMFSELDNSYFYANRIYNLITEIKPLSIINS